MENTSSILPVLPACGSINTRAGINENDLHKNNLQLRKNYQNFEQFMAAKSLYFNINMFFF